MGGLAVRPPTSHAFLLIAVALLVSSYAGPQVSGMTEAGSLLKFKSSLSNQEAIPNWDPPIPPCSSGNTSNWLGVICINGNVWGLQLENMGLGGDIDIDALSGLPELKILSLMRNEFEGHLPELRRLPKLRGIYLSNNHFSGDIPDDAFSGMDSLRRLFLANNAFSGKIPSSLAKVPKLVELRLEGNQFEGTIPNFQQQELPHVDVANNQLEGPVPESLKNLKTIWHSHAQLTPLNNIVRTLVSALYMSSLSQKSHPCGMPHDQLLTRPPSCCPATFQKLIQTSPS